MSWKQDPIAFLDDATNEVYDAFLCEEEGTVPILTGLKTVIGEKGLFCSLYTDRGSHFFHTAEADGPVDRTRLTQVGRALAQLGIEHIPTYSPEARGRMTVSEVVANRTVLGFRRRSSGTCGGCIRCWMGKLPVSGSSSRKSPAN